MNELLDRHAPIGGLARSVRRFLGRGLPFAALLLAAASAVLWMAGSAGAMAFSLIAVGTLLLTYTWRAQGIGLPIVPIIALQTLVAYGLPIAIRHDVLHQYPEDLITQAGWEVLIFCGSFALAWRLGMEVFRPAPPVSYALIGFEHGSARLQRLGFGLVAAASVYQLLQSLNYLDPIFNALPNGSYSLAITFVAAASACGFFLVAMFVGSGRLSAPAAGCFWLLLAGNCLISASGFLLSAPITMLAAVAIGLFWGGGRMPWRYLLVVAVALAVLNLGKFTMRDRYWTAAGGDAAPQLTLGEMPARYTEWFEASVQSLSGRETNSPRSRTKEDAKGQSLLERINNLQNLLFVINAVEVQHIAPLYGKTYTIIPALLTPRILWPDKPRSHEGQVILNVHFGRQALESTFETYIAWGLLPEAYGNFGAKLGGVILGVVLGFLLAWVENATARKRLFSLEGFVAFTVLLGVANSFEMVASVLVTSIFQSIEVLVAACFLFVQRTSDHASPPPSP